MQLYCQVLLLSLWGLSFSSPVPPSLDTSPAAVNLAVPVPPDPTLPSSKGDSIGNRGLRNSNRNHTNPRLHHQPSQTDNNSNSGRAYQNIAFLNPALNVPAQRAPSPVAQRTSFGKMTQPEMDVSYSRAMVPNYFVMNPPYSKVALGIDSDNIGKSQAPHNETGNELDSIKFSNLTMREQHLMWKKEMLEEKSKAVDSKVYQVQNNIIVHSHNASEKHHAPYKMNTTKSGNKAQINIDNSPLPKPLHGEGEKNAEKSLKLTTPKITNRRLLVNNSGLNPNEITLRPNEIRVSVTLRDKDGRKIIVPAVYTPKGSAPPPLTNTEDLALIPVDRNLDIKDIVTTTSPQEPITTEEITTISERIASHLSTTKTSQSTGTVTSSRIPVTPIPSRIFRGSTDSLVVKNDAVPLSAPMPTTGFDLIPVEVTTALSIAQSISTTNVLHQSVTTAPSTMTSDRTGRPLHQETQDIIIHQSSTTTASDISNPSLHLGESNKHQTDFISPSTMSSNHQSGSQSLDTSISPSSTSLESILLSSEKAFNESKKLSQTSNSTEVPPFLQDIITKIDERLTELIRETVSRYVENGENATTAPNGAEKAIDDQTSLVKINLDGAGSGMTKAPAILTTRPVSLLRQSLDAALGITTKAPAASTTKSVSLLRQSLDAALGITTKAPEGSTTKPLSLLRLSLDAALRSSTQAPTKAASGKKQLIRISVDGDISYPKKPPTTPAPRFSRIRDSGILGLTQIEPILERITGEISNGADRVRKELSYLAEDSANNLMKNVEDASDRVVEISATSYRGALQTRDAMNKLLGRAVENLGNFVSNAVQDTVKTAFGTAQSVGQFIRDLNVNAMDTIINRGTAVRNLFSNTINDMSEATNRTVTVLGRVIEKNTKTLLDQK